jgi:trk system potassium uptake protein TrkA
LGIIEVKIPANSSTLGKPISQLPLPQGILLSLLIRKGEKAQMLTPATVLESDDRVVVVARAEDEEALCSALTGGVEKKCLP